MDRLDEIRAFTAVAEARSFTQGARKLGVSSAQVSKLVARLENRLGARLLNRTTRDVSLTDTGQAYLEQARDLLESFDALETSVRDQSGPSGTLRVSAPVSFGKNQLTPALLDFASGCSAVSLDVSFADRMVNLVEEGFDDVAVSPRMVYVDASRPRLVEGFTRRTFTAMVEAVGDRAIAEGDARRAVAHATSGQPLQQNLVCVLEGEQ